MREVFYYRSPPPPGSGTRRPHGYEARITTEPRETTILEEFNVPCPTCGTLCNSVKTTTIQGKSGEMTAEYTPVANPNT